MEVQGGKNCPAQPSFVWHRCLLRTARHAFDLGFLSLQGGLLAADARAGRHGDQPSSQGVSETRVPENLGRRLLSSWDVSQGGSGRTVENLPLAAGFALLTARQGSGRRAGVGAPQQPRETKARRCLGGWPGGASTAGM